MGVIDEKWFRFTCPACGEAETLAVTDRGSGWSGSIWDALPNASAFDIVSDGKRGAEPDVTSATCRACRRPANVESKYGFKRPAGW